MTYARRFPISPSRSKHAAGLSGALKDGLYGDLTEDLVDAVLEEAGKYASTSSRR